MNDPEDKFEEEFRLEEAKASVSVRSAVCTVCRETWVDVLNGEDTCADCRSS
jgi:hypothetical protein